jgi:hypothetical protein
MTRVFACVIGSAMATGTIHAHAASKSSKPVGGDAADFRQPPALTGEVPPRFIQHDFAAHCYNAMGCRAGCNERLAPQEAYSKPRKPYGVVTTVTHAERLGVPAPSPSISAPQPWAPSSSPHQSNSPSNGHARRRTTLHVSPKTAVRKFLQQHAPRAD